ncbi:50S ribosomal protein L24 [[Mycoplasma] mobile]|uniref:Large ribosomal subunit protein uL24 n=1 Tax=Mycoplasma mobile (strain ATCC 43663 / 163K / NCTC 11711) TaxID=267748 RepID=RL24_MYCM1|nr:50S ribosomal protein L24 [[Mycoplasma] mobile]Q6KI44.1 RecName: Full=Large ribosomal subunit protein uL24; AltName: Full=50S ribosomal protein L24 [Mycoplasma mobile 163K]AAT27732.1 50S ribosomal protein l24 [Mycoplasma mobile 163K]
MKLQKSKLHKNDQVLIISGKFKGRSGQIIAIDYKNETVKVRDINKVTKHVKPTQQKTEGGIETFEAGIHISNVALKFKTPKLKSKDKATSDTSITPLSAKEHTKIGYKIENNKKVRIAKRTGKSI